MGNAPAPILLYSFSCSHSKDSNRIIKKNTHKATHTKFVDVIKC